MINQVSFNSCQNMMLSHQKLTCYLCCEEITIVILLCRVVKSSWLPVKIAAYLVSISWILCLAFLYGWRFVNKISLD